MLKQKKGRATIYDEKGRKLADLAGDLDFCSPLCKTIIEANKNMEINPAKSQINSFNNAQNIKIRDLPDDQKKIISFILDYKIKYPEKNPTQKQIKNALWPMHNNENKVSRELKNLQDFKIVDYKKGKPKYVWFANEFLSL